MSKCLFFKLLRAIEINKRYQNAYKYIFQSYRISRNKYFSLKTLSPLCRFILKVNSIANPRVPIAVERVII